eukprot:CAMPEP_0117428206 /NCGR_PEP_ID=MMETSP0758-20121206/7972_1 /TAXON_ID=63605 /ORGANISM="Percolomonas cosmopolitus, Strain AE-1 (ATCC 50343)" /LENGTH=276 /DNA_ID=CAMNT_0005214447 /DNA_START=23 /DNA_END=850 /DNA_ORIENTATION=+
MNPFRFEDLVPTNEGSRAGYDEDESDSDLEEEERMDTMPRETIKATIEWYKDEPSQVDFMIMGTTTASMKFLKEAFPSTTLTTKNQQQYEDQLGKLTIYTALEDEEEEDDLFHRVKEYFSIRLVNTKTQEGKPCTMMLVLPQLSPQTSQQSTSRLMNDKTLANRVLSTIKTKLIEKCLAYIILDSIFYTKIESEEPIKAPACFAIPQNVNLKSCTIPLSTPNFLEGLPAAMIQYAAIHNKPCHVLMAVQEEIDPTTYAISAFEAPIRTFFELKKVN